MADMGQRKLRMNTHFLKPSSSAYPIAKSASSAPDVKAMFGRIWRVAELLSEAAPHVVQASRSKPAVEKTQR